MRLAAPPGPRITLGRAALEAGTMPDAVDLAVFAPAPDALAPDALAPAARLEGTLTLAAAPAHVRLIDRNPALSHPSAKAGTLPALTSTSSSKAPR